jgi:uncharacterized membrane protein
VDAFPIVMILMLGYFVLARRDWFVLTFTTKALIQGIRIARRKARARGEGACSA